MRKLGSEEMKFKSFCCKTGNICSGMHRITLTDIQLGMHYIKTMRGLAVKFLYINLYFDKSKCQKIAFSDYTEPDSPSMLVGMPSKVCSKSWTSLYLCMT